MDSGPAPNPHRSGKRLLIAFSAVAMLTVLSVYVQRMEASHTLRSNEAVLKQDLRTMREAIDQYIQDKMKAPQALEDLVTAGYLHRIPKDPFTHASNTWKVTPEQEDVLQTTDQTQRGITDVHSGSILISSEGTAYNTW